MVGNAVGFGLFVDYLLIYLVWLTSVIVGCVCLLVFWLWLVLCCLF